MPEQKTIFSIAGHNKGLSCPFKPITCQKGKCKKCQIYLDMVCELAKRGEILVMCAWCGVEMGRKPSNGQSGVSHGICLECEQKHSGELGGNSLNQKG